MFSSFSFFFPLLFYFNTTYTRRLAPLIVRPNFPRTEVIGALGVVPPAPLLGNPDVTGDVGLVCYCAESPSLKLATIIHFFTIQLPTITKRWPGARSVVVLDNMPSHRANEVAFRGAL